MHEWSRLSAHELIEPKSARTSQTCCGSAATVQLRSMSATASPYAAKSALRGDVELPWLFFRRRRYYVEFPGPDACERYCLRWASQTTLRRANDGLSDCGGRH